MEQDNTLQQVLTEIKLIRQENFDMFKRHAALEDKINDLEDLTRKTGSELKFSASRQSEYMRLKQTYANRVYLSVAALFLLSIVRILNSHSIYIDGSSEYSSNKAQVYQWQDYVSATTAVLMSVFGATSALKSYLLDRDRGT